MKQTLKCMLGMHDYEIHKEYDTEMFCRNAPANVDDSIATFFVGHEHTIVQKCKHCGKIKITRYTA